VWAVEEDQPRHTIRLRPRKALSRKGPYIVADDRHPRQPKQIKQSGQILCQQIGR
jgi:hypothetical protein